MMRAAAVRARPLAFAAGRPARSSQWQSLSHPTPLSSSFIRSYADERKPDATVLPGSSSSKAPSANPPAPPSLNSTDATASGTTAPQPIAKTPPPPPAIPPSPVAGGAPTKPPRRRSRLRLLWYLIGLLGLSYAGGVYYALVNDNFHDFFTEYVPFGEDAVLFFEEREFKRRFPDGRPTSRSLYPQTSGETKVTVPGRSGVSAKLASGNNEKASGQSESEVKKTPSASKVASKAKSAIESKKEDAKAAAAKAVERVKPSESSSSSSSTAAASSQKAASAPIKPIDNLSIDNAADPVVQDVTKILNDIITVINADSAGGKYGSAIEKAKDSIKSLAGNVSAFRDLATKAADEQKRQDQLDFDKGANELVRRIEQQQRDQELKIREEWESERERLAKSYQEKLQAELDSLQKIADQRLKNELLDQATKLQDAFATSVRDKVETERSGRLSKLNDLSSSVSELEKLTSQWTKVLDANLKTQHLVVAVDAVRSVVEDPERSKPFIHELAALKDIAQEDSVVDAAIGSINPTAYQRGLPTSAQLIDRFRRVASEVRKASLLPEDAGAASHAASYVLSKVMFKKQGLAIGEDVESVLTRTETLLEEGNLDDAAREMNSLQGWAKVLSRDWLAECRTVLEARQAIDVMATQAKLHSLLVE